MLKLNRSRGPLMWALVIGAGLLVAAGGVLAQTDAATAEPEVHMAFGAGFDRANRTLVGRGNEFAAEDFSAEAGQVYCLTQLANMSAPTTVTHVWYHEGKTMARVELKVGGASWRTWSSKRILPAWTGQWEVKVLDADGMVLASSGFIVQ